MNIVFIICYSLYKYVVIFFKLYNVLAIFQLFINKILSFYLNNFCIVYIHNFLIYNSIEKKHLNYINKIFAKLDKIKFYFNINKYIFFIKQIEYLNLIITFKEIWINS